MKGLTPTDLGFPHRIPDLAIQIINRKIKENFREGYSSFDICEVRQELFETCDGKFTKQEISNMPWDDLLTIYNEWQIRQDYGGYYHVTPASSTNQDYKI